MGDLLAGRRVLSVEPALVSWCLDLNAYRCRREEPGKLAAWRKAAPRALIRVISAAENEPAVFDRAQARPIYYMNNEPSGLCPQMDFDAPHGLLVNHPHYWNQSSVKKGGIERVGIPVALLGEIDPIFPGLRAVEGKPVVGISQSVMYPAAAWPIPTEL